MSGTSKTLGNAEPTEAERERMLAVLNGLSSRIGARENYETFAPATFNEADGTAELRWATGSRVWVSAWIQPGPGRALLVWRHPSYRYSRDDQYLYDACNAYDARKTP
jgi:hypothetical protein